MGNTMRTTHFATDSLGKIYDLSSPKEKEIFKVKERRIKEAQKRHDGGILSHRDREELKRKGRLLMFSDAPLYKRYMGVQYLLQAYFSRSMELALRDGYEHMHPTFEEFACYFDRTDIPEDLCVMLNKEFPYKSGVIEVGDSYWRPRSR